MTTNPEQIATTSKFLQNIGIPPDIAEKLRLHLGINKIQNLAYLADPLKTGNQNIEDIQHSLQGANCPRLREWATNNKSITTKILHHTPLPDNSLDGAYTMAMHQIDVKASPKVLDPQRLEPKRVQT